LMARQTRLKQKPSISFWTGKGTEPMDLIQSRPACMVSGVVLVPAMMSTMLLTDQRQLEFPPGDK
jgi:hypothetical protein